MQDDETRENREEGGDGMEILQEPPPLPWTGAELAAFLLRDPKSSTCGLRNLGNTCYLNSVLQAVAHIPVLSTYLISGWPSNSHSPGSGNEHVPNQARRDFCSFLARTNLRLWSGEYKDFAPRNVYRTMIDTVPEFSQNGQQDAEEALTYILNNLHDDLFVPVPTELHPARRVILQLEHERLALLKDQGGEAVDEDKIAQAYEAYKRSIVSDSFQSLFAQRVTCETCKQQSLTVQECFALPLELPSSSPLPSSSSGVSGTSPTKRLSGTGKTQESPPATVAVQSPPSVLPSAPLTPVPPPPPPPQLASTGSWFGTLKGMIFGSPNGSGAGGNGSNVPPLDLDDCLKSFFAPEILRGEDQYYCNQCKCKVDAKKTLELAHLPQVLCLQLKRFTSGSSGHGGNHGVSKRSLFSRDTGAGLKNFTRVRFPVDQPLDLSAYLKKPDPPLDGTNGEEEEGAKYQLIAVVRHSGSATYGHYVAQCRTPDNKWYTFDDELVSPTNENGLFQDAYLLIYDRIPTPAEQAKKDLALTALVAPCPPEEEDSFVSREWAIKFETMCDPGPMDNLCLQCPHNLLAFPAAAKNMNERVVSVSSSAYRELERVYSARHGPLQGLVACEICKLAHLEREQQRHEQSQLLARFASHHATIPPSSGTTIMVPKPWYQQWIRFIHNDCGPLGRGPFEGAPPPGPPSNSSLYVTEGGELKPNLKLNIHYVAFPLDVYEELCKAFGTPKAGGD
ncbi:hypothetical protein BASA81_001634 [Batrachochytrium salamandrivorans]|nr:hypothetical protein BASA81_001634 [Batrachochytrium salamandrivorans]